MRLGNLAAGLAAAVLLAAPATAAPLSAYGKLPTIEAGAVSPNGKYVAVVTTQGQNHQITFVEIATGRSASKGDIATAEVKVRDLRWAGDTHLLMTTSKTDRFSYFGSPKAEFLIAYNVDLTAMKMAQIVPAGRGFTSLSAISSIPIVRQAGGKPMIFVQGPILENGGALALFRVDPETNRSELVEPGEPDTVDWIVGGEGQAVGQELYNDRSTRWRLKMHLGSGGWREAQTATTGQRVPFTMGLGRDGKSVLYAMFADGHWSWREAAPDGAAGPVVLQGDPSPIFDPADGHLIGHRALVGDEARYTFFDPKDAAAWTAVTKAFAGNTVWLQSWSADRRKVLVLADSPTEGPAYAMIDLDAKKATFLGPQYAELTETDVYPRQAVRFAAKDGTQLSGYLTLPKAGGRNLPLIVFPHGGPAARDEPGFDWWAQAMASRGYAVLQVNFRGSDGFGMAFLESGYGQWGRKMQTDLSDGVRDLAAKGIVDPKRVCIVGASYGGYAALAGATLDPDVYRCAVSFAGLSDLRGFITWAKDRNGQSAYRYWTRFMGAQDARDAALTEISPIEHIDRVKVPVLLIHGRDDTVVPLAQSEAMAEALKKAGKPVELVVQKGGDHWLSNSDTRLQMLASTMAFVEKNNPPN